MMHTLEMRTYKHTAGTLNVVKDRVTVYAEEVAAVETAKTKFRKQNIDCWNVPSHKIEVLSHNRKAEDVCVCKKPILSPYTNNDFCMKCGKEITA